MMSHLKYVVMNKRTELPHRMVLTLISKKRNVNLSLYATEEPSIQGSFGSHLLYSMGFCQSGKVWTNDEEGDSEHEDAGPRKGKRKATSMTKWNAIRKPVTSPRKSSRFAKGKSVISITDEEDSVLSQSSIKATEVEGNLELSEEEKEDL